MDGMNIDEVVHDLSTTFTNRWIDVGTVRSWCTAARLFPSMEELAEALERHPGTEHRREGRHGTKIAQVRWALEIKRIVPADPGTLDVREMRRDRAQGGAAG